jgi:hypothetical protein
MFFRPEGTIPQTEPSPNAFGSSITSPLSAIRAPRAPASGVRVALDLDCGLGRLGLQEASTEPSHRGADLTAAGKPPAAPRCGDLQTASSSLCGCVLGSRVKRRCFGLRQRMVALFNHLPDTSEPCSKGPLAARASCLAPNTYAPATDDA